MAAVIRECVDRALEPVEPDRSALYDRAEVVVGQFEDHSGARDLARGHDDYLATSFE